MLSFACLRCRHNQEHPSEPIKFVYIISSTAAFSSSAKEFCRSKRILLMEGPQMAYWAPLLNVAPSIYSSCKYQRLLMLFRPRIRCHTALCLPVCLDADFWSSDLVLQCKTQLADQVRRASASGFAEQKQVAHSMALLSPAPLAMFDHDNLLTRIFM